MTLEVRAMAVKLNSKEKRDEYVRSLKEPPALVPSAPPPPAPAPSNPKSS
jgi:hypothetical protein